MRPWFEPPTRDFWLPIMWENVKYGGIVMLRWLWRMAQAVGRSRSAKAVGWFMFYTAGALVILVGLFSMVKI